jgi:ADP-ribosyl-[dinitrogen reductase] hydrolase
MTRRDRFRGALLGLAVGDAVGTTVEFMAPGTFPPVREMVGGGPFSLPPGAWTDDTSMALCLAESLVERRTFDPVDQLHRYVRWYRDGHWSSTGRCFDIGNATRAALERFEQTGEPYPGDAAPDAAGNGPLMKLAPVVLAYASKPAEAIRHAGESARTTHGAREAADACGAYAALLLAALNGTWPRGEGASAGGTTGAAGDGTGTATGRASGAAATSATPHAPRWSASSARASRTPAPPRPTRPATAR